jgi:cation/acetate symporter
VTAAFSLAASIFFPSLVLGIFWRRATYWGAVSGMLAGFSVSVFYMVTNQPWLRNLFGIEAPVSLWWGIQPLSAGVFGVPAGACVLVLVSYLTPKPDAQTQIFISDIRG